MQQMMDGELIIQRHESDHYSTFFNRRTGFFVRYEDDGFPEPFWSSDGPELLDISITNYCERACKFCYRQANMKGQHMAYLDLLKVLDEAKNAGVLQIALGGGNPNQHPYFCNILEEIRARGIVPSYTSNGEGLTDEILDVTAVYCGAMAISLYPPYDVYEKLIARIYSYGIKVNLHIILKTDTIDMLTGWLHSNPSFFKYVNAIIILNYKPVGSNQDLTVRDTKKLQMFYQAANQCKTVKIGFDSCSVPGIVTWMDVNPLFVESCESACFSAFISEEMKMYPCSFMIGTDMYGNLRESSLLDIWRYNKYFVAHRQKKQDVKCTLCKHKKLCNGGCIFLPSINQCNF